MFEIFEEQMETLSAFIEEVSSTIEDIGPLNVEQKEIQKALSISLVNALLYIEDMQDTL